MLFISFYVCLSGQNYQPLVIEGNSWSVVNWSWGWAWTDYYFLQGDTVINDTAYKKLYFTTDSTLQNDAGYFCGLREDTLSGEVYFNYPYLGDCLLYKFGMDIEETAVVTSLACESINMIVADVDTITDLMGIERRRMRMEGWFDSYVEYWIEGIGSTLGLLTAGNTYCVADFNQDLLCFNKQGQLIYMNPMYTECHVTMINLRELEAEKNAVKICPNPVTTSSKILINKEIHVIRMEIYNSRGLLISEHDPAILKIHRGVLVPGLYVLKVITKNSGIINTKFVIN
jgi:hypothetical protein